MAMEMQMNSQPGTHSGLFLGISGVSQEYIGGADEESISICPLLTPSPTSHFHHPLAINTNQGMGYERHSPSSEDTEISTLPASLANPTEFSDAAKTRKKNSDLFLGKGEGSSTSSSCSAMQDSTATAQLLNYLTLASDPSSQDKGLRPATTLLGLGKAQDYGFVSWNWELIRKWCFWGVMSLAVACVCVIFDYMTTIPRSCDPLRSWHQGSLIYQVFPPSFQDSNGNGVGDLKGITSRIPYLEKLGVKGVRLSYIFPSQNYPEHFDKVYNLTQIESSIGDFDDFRVLVESLHKRNISAILDLPIFPYFDELKTTEFKNRDWEEENKEHVKPFIMNNHILLSPQNKSHVDSTERGQITAILTFWLNIGVDGFYLEGLQNFVNDDKFISQLMEWRTELHKYNQAFDKVLICSDQVVQALQQPSVKDFSTKMTVLMKTFDLINIKIDPFTYGTVSVKKKIDEIQSGTMYSKPGYPWAYWTCGDMTTNRLASRAPNGSVALAAIITSMALPGSSGIFYGDEIALLNIPDTAGERRDLAHAHHLGPMFWSQSPYSYGFSHSNVLPWLPASRAELPISSASIVASMSSIKNTNPGLYMNAVWKNQQLQPNTAIRYIDKNIIALERTYPRRHSFLLIANFGDVTVQKDLSNHYYGGEVVLNTQEIEGQSTYMTFHKIELIPGQVILAKLDK